MYAAFAVGVPGRHHLYAGYGFAAIAFATTLIPLGTLVLRCCASVAPTPQSPISGYEPSFLEKTRRMGNFHIY
jgi:hypothetical protein